MLGKNEAAYEAYGSPLKANIEYLIHESSKVAA